MSKILLSPILDLKYYLPKFSKFNIANLFNKKDYKYYLNLDIDDILNSNEENKKENNKMKIILKIISLILII